MLRCRVLALGHRGGHLGASSGPLLVGSSLDLLGQRPAAAIGGLGDPAGQPEALVGNQRRRGPRAGHRGIRPRQG